MRYQRGWALDVHGRYEFGNTWAVSSFFGFIFPLKCHMLLNWTTGLKHMVSPLGLFVCKGDMCMFMLMCVHRSVCTFVRCRDSWEQSHILFLSLPSTFLLRKGLSLAWNVFNWIAWLANHQALESFCFHLPSTEVASMLRHAQLFAFLSFLLLFPECEFWGPNSGPRSRKLCTWRMCHLADTPWGF